MSGKFGNSTLEVSRQEFSLKSGKMPFHGNRGYCLRAQDFCSWVRHRPSKGIRRFLGPTGFYRRFIKDILKISRPLCKLLERDTKFDFNESCKATFDEIKSRLVTAPIMVTPGWNKEFEIMCDASDYAMGAVLGQRTKKMFKAIYYTSKTFNEAQENYSTTEK